MIFRLRHKNICIILNKNNLTLLLIEKLIEEIKINKNIKDEIEKYGLYSFLFGIYGWLYAWFKDGLVKTPTEIINMFDEYHEQKLFNNTKTIKNITS